ncbi:TPA: hypothetical protein ACK3JR_002131 [Mannheimia haemolytica]
MNNSIFPDRFIYTNGDRFFYTLEDEWTNDIKLTLVNYDEKNRWYILFGLLKKISEEILLDTYEDIKKLELYHSQELEHHEENLLKETIVSAWQENNQSSSQFGAFAAYLFMNAKLSTEQAYDIFKYPLSICIGELDIEEAKEFIDEYFSSI